MGLRYLSVAAIAASLAWAPGVTPVAAQEATIPVLVPITGFLSLEGTSQRNGAVLAVRNAPAGVRVQAPVSDTATAPETAVNALERAMGGRNVIAVGASMLGPQVLAMLPLARDFKVPLVTVSGSAAVTEQNNPFVFRFFPGDAVAKVAHARYVVEELGRKRVAMLYQTTAYGQGGRTHLVEQFKRLGAELVFEEGLEVAVKDFLPVLSKARAANPDVLVLHLHGGPTVLAVKQAAAMNLALPIVAGSGMHQPQTAALLEPGELRGVCAETGSSPVSGGSAEMDRFLADYRREFNAEPDAFALGQYDGTTMVLQAMAAGAKTPADVQKALSSSTHKGLAMTYKSDGKGNMAHSAVIICYDGQTRVPVVRKRYDNITGVL
jgi:branched-chain amino acid transport system substrate-binding protein